MGLVKSEKSLKDSYSVLPFISLNLTFRLVKSSELETQK